VFLLARPDDDRIRRFLASQREEPFSYEAVGATRSTTPPGYVVDHNRTRLGSGPDCFARAVEAVRAWTMFDFTWLRLLWPDAPIEAGTTVGLLIRHYGFWSLNATRIVYTVDEAGPVWRYGFAYGTLPEHGERGEERFTVEWVREDDSVWYDVLAFSRPNYLLARVGYPLTRALQRRFAVDSKRAMAEACG
jgi:uncharacterized protein (UPF0548 family)